MSKKVIICKFYFILKSVLQWFLFVFAAIGFAVAVRVFLLASFMIPTPSMAPAILAGDYILVNKLIPGPRIFKSWDFLNETDFEMKRLKGYRTVRRNDILVFNFPYSYPDKLEPDWNVFYAKRCVAIPGDTFYIDNGIYKVKQIPDTLGYLPLQQVVAKRPAAKFVPARFSCFPQDPAFGWNIKNFGPLYIPGINDTVAIDTLSVLLYKNLMEYETTQAITIDSGRVFLGLKAIDNYVFRKNYYFMVGEYAPDSQDSRYWGLLPEDLIVGKAFMIWKSKDLKTSKWRWKRFFKKI